MNTSPKLYELHLELKLWLSNHMMKLVTNSDTNNMAHTYKNNKKKSNCRKLLMCLLNNHNNMDTHSYSALYYV